MNLETQEHLPTLRNLLVFRIRELEAELDPAQRDASAAAAAAEVSDSKDAADRRQRTEVDAESERVEREDLRLCRSALHRLDLGLYGDCVDCREPVALARLMVQPEAERCAACQAAFERRHPPHGMA